MLFSGMTYMPVGTMASEAYVLVSGISLPGQNLLHGPRISGTSAANTIVGGL
jgi:hypothetical protein